MLVYGSKNRRQREVRFGIACFLPSFVFAIAIVVLSCFLLSLPQNCGLCFVLPGCVRPFICLPPVCVGTHAVCCIAPPSLPSRYSLLRFASPLSLGFFVPIWYRHTPTTRIPAPPLPTHHMCMHACPIKPQPSAKNKTAPDLQSHQTKFTPWASCPSSCRSRCCSRRPRPRRLSPSRPCSPRPRARPRCAPPPPPVTYFLGVWFGG